MRVEIPINAFLSYECEEFDDKPPKLYMGADGSICCEDRKARLMLSLDQYDYERAYILDEEQD